MAVEDVSAVQQQLARFAEIVDTGAFERLGDVFDTDIVWDFDGTHVVEGLPALIARVGATLTGNPNQRAMMHNITNIIVEVAGDEAESISNCTGSHKGGGAYEGQLYCAWLTYRDSWIRRREGWRIIKRVYRTKFSSGPREIVYATGKA